MAYVDLITGIDLIKNKKMYYIKKGYIVEKVPEVYVKGKKLMQLGIDIIKANENMYGTGGVLNLAQSSFQYTINGVFIDCSVDSKLLYHEPSQYNN